MIFGGGIIVSRPCSVSRVARLRKRADFLRLRNGRKVVMPAFILLCAPQPRPEGGKEGGKKPREAGREVLPDAASAGIEGAPRIGYTVTKRIGNAVRRNRVRRRLREAVRAVAPGLVAAGHDYVVIARGGAADIAFAALKDDLRKAFARACARRARRGRGGGSRRGATKEGKGGA